MEVQSDILARGFRAIDALLGMPKSIPQAPLADEPKPCLAVPIPPRQEPPEAASEPKPEAEAAYRQAVQQAHDCELPDPGALMDAGIRLLDWQPKRPPVVIADLRIVNDVPGFIRDTLAQLESAVAHRDELAARHAVELLAQLGVSVRLEIQDWTA